MTAASNALPVLLASILSLTSMACGPSAPAADLLLHNAVVHTLDPASPRAESVAVRDGIIQCVGSASDCERHGGPETEWLDLEGKVVYPGFADSHAHLSGIGLREMTLNLESARSLADLLELVRGRAGEAEPGEWITGRGWIEARWSPPHFPTAADLDSVSPDNPVWLTRADGHASVANSRALTLAGVTAFSRAPSGGEIMLDPSSGRPTGMLLDRAQRLVAKHLPESTPELRREALRRGARYAAAHGWTQVSIAGNSFDELALIEELIAANEMPVRIYDAIGGPGPDADRLLDQGPRTGDSKLVVRGIKLVMDGALGSQGAALLEPYRDHDTRGLVMHGADALMPLLTRALEQGVQIQTHAIGDRANRLILDLYEQAFAAVPPAKRAVADPRWRIEHAQILHPDDVPRLAALGVVASMQASHAITDLHFAERRLGAERLIGAYAWRSLVDSGAVVAGGSDAPVEKGDPIVELYAAAVRRDLEGFAAQHWNRDQRLTRNQALHTLTKGAAWATFQESQRGAIEVGKWADFTVLSGDFLVVSDEEILALFNEMTIVGGRVVYRR